MKILKISILILLISTFSVLKSVAQAGMEDVVYLKNGNVYRGIIIEQVPNVSLKVQTLGGNIFAVAITDVLKITKEAKFNAPQNEEHEGYQSCAGHGYGPFNGHWFPWQDSSHRDFKIRTRGYFFQSQLLIENLQGGVRIINGYKFNRFAYLGIGIGVDIVKSSPFNQTINNLDSKALSGIYLPLYLYYGGDILKKRITPFYYLEAGYSMGYANSHDIFNNGSPHSLGGGVMGGAGFGVKLITAHRATFSVAATMDFKGVRYDAVSTQYDSFGNAYVVTEKQNALLVFPGIRLGLGF